MELLLHSDLWVLIPFYVRIPSPLIATLLSFLGLSSMEHDSSFFVPSGHL